MWPRAKIMACGHAATIAQKMLATATVNCNDKLVVESWLSNTAPDLLYVVHKCPYQQNCQEIDYFYVGNYIYC